MQKNLTLAMTAALAAGAALTARSQSVITFNEFPSPAMFYETTNLTTAYSSLGVTFSGPSPGGVGALLNDSTWHSAGFDGATNFFAFNNGGTTTETILFSGLQNSVSIEANGQYYQGTESFTMTAYNSTGGVVGSDTETSSTQWVALQVIGNEDIADVVLTVPALASFNDLTFDPAPTPEPSTIALAGLGIAGLLAARRKQ